MEPNQLKDPNKIHWLRSPKKGSTASIASTGDSTASTASAASTGDSTASTEPARPDDASAASTGDSTASAADVEASKPQNGFFICNRRSSLYYECKISSEYYQP